MKKLEKLNHLSKNVLDARQQYSLKGGTCWCTNCSGCICSSWDGTGLMPPSQSSNNMGIGAASGYAGSSLGSHF